MLFKSNNKKPVYKFGKISVRRFQEDISKTNDFKEIGTHPKGSYWEDFIYIIDFDDNMILIQKRFIDHVVFINDKKRRRKK